MIKKILFTLVLLALPFPVWAQGQCYSAAELKAEQWLRLHSELMVITVTCHQSSVGDNLVPFYTGFTKANIKVLHDAEQTMIRYYKANYGNGVERLDKLRTRLGNEFGQTIADISAPQFCAERRDKVLTMYSATAAQLEDEVARLTATATPYERVCDEPQTRIAKKTQ